MFFYLFSKALFKLKALVHNYFSTHVLNIKDNLMQYEIYKISIFSNITTNTIQRATILLNYCKSISGNIYLTRVVNSIIHYP